MANIIEHAAVFQAELDKAAVEQATSGWMELNEDKVKYTGGNEVKIASLEMDGLGTYVRDKGFVDGNVNLKWETKQMTQDRGRRFTFDEHEVDETNFLLTAANVVGEFQRTKVIPEIDAFRYSTLAALAIDKGNSIAYTPAESTLLAKLYNEIAEVQDIVGEVPLVITMSTKVAAMLAMSDKLRRSIDATDFKQGDVTLKVQSLDGQYPIIRAGSGRMKTAILFKDGKTEGQEAGGFEAAEGAKDINWIICPKDAPVAVSRTDEVRIFDPKTFQQMRSWSLDYRRFHDLWVPSQALKSIRVCIGQ